MGNKKRRQPVKQKLSPLVYAFISFGAFLTGMVILFLFVFKAAELTSLGIGENVYYVLLIPMALAAAVLLFGALRSYASYKGRVLSGYLEIGGPAVIFLLVLILGFRLLPDKADPFYFTLRLRDAGGTAVLKGEGKLHMLQRTLGLNKEDEALFTNIPAKFKNQSVRVELSAPGWQFKKDDKNDKEKNVVFCLLTGNETTLAIERDDSLSTLRFSVTDGNRRAVPGAAVLVEGREVGKTDTYGMLTAKLDKTLQKPEVSVAIHKPGFKIWEGKGYPSVGAVIKTVLEKMEK
jgi:hypothetical protein